MSRIGKQPIAVAGGVKVVIEGRAVRVEGPKGKLALTIPYGIEARLADSQITVQRAGDDKRTHALHGLTRTLIANAVSGVTQEFRKDLEIEGLGYKAQVQGKVLNLQLGYSHPILFPIPEGITITTAKPTQIAVQGISKYLVGQVAADIRALCPPEPYKGKGIKYAGEIIRRKVGKAAATK